MKDSNISFKLNALIRKIESGQERIKFNMLAAEYKRLCSGLPEKQQRIPFTVVSHNEPIMGESPELIREIAGSFRYICNNMDDSNGLEQIEALFAELSKNINAMEILIEDFMDKANGELSLVKYPPNKFLKEFTKANKETLLAYNIWQVEFDKLTDKFDMDNDLKVIKLLTRANIVMTAYMNAFIRLQKIQWKEYMIGMSWGIKYVKESLILMKQKPTNESTYNELANDITSI